VFFSDSESAKSKMAIFFGVINRSSGYIEKFASHQKCFSKAVSTTVETVKDGKYEKWITEAKWRWMTLNLEKLATLCLHRGSKCWTFLSF